MKWINAEQQVTVTIYDEEHEEYLDRTMSVEEMLDTYTNEGCPTIYSNPEQTRWISIEERLPEEDGQYLITVKYKPEADYENIYAEHGEWINGRWDMFCFGHCGEVEDIIAWMPLPKPYKAESEE